MWKYVSRRIRDTFERSVNHIDKFSTTGVVNSAGNASEEKAKRSPPPCRWFCPRKCWSSFKDDNNTNSKRWNFDQLNRSWIGAITWSSALVVGWYTSQFLHLKYKYSKHEQGKNCPALQNLIGILYPYAAHANKNAACLNSPTDVEKIIKTFTPTTYLVSNDRSNSSIESTSSASSGTNTNQESSDGDFGEVLNSIENRLGLAAIENGQLQDGLALLRSAANRNHAPALYNLGLCYEIGIGVTADEKIAVQFYRSAAAREHPGALYNLGIYYGQGRGGLSRDLETATRLLKLAAVQGQQDAIKALKSIESEPAKPSPRNDVTWNDQYSGYVHNDNIVPSFTSLFVENVNYRQEYYSSSVY